MSADRDRLAAQIAECLPGAGGDLSWLKVEAGYVNVRHLVELIEREGWRPPGQVAATVPQLDQLRDARGEVYERDVDNAGAEIAEQLPARWWPVGRDDDIDSSMISLPVTVLWFPTEEARQ